MITKEERLLVYKKTLELAIKDYELTKRLYEYKMLNPDYVLSSQLNLLGLCYLTLSAINEMSFGDNPELEKPGLKDLPELLACKPKDKKPGEYWWPTSFYNEETRHKRIEVLEQIIKNLEQSC